MRKAIEDIDKKKLLICCAYGAVLIGIFLVALLWRWRYAARAEMYTYDSYYYMGLARSISRGEGYVFRSHPHFKFMPFYPYLISVFTYLGFTVETAAKLANVMPSAACVFTIFGITAITIRPFAGILAASLFVFEPITTNWSSLPMSEGIFALLITLSIFCFLVWLKYDVKYLMYGAALAGGMAIITRWEGGLILPLYLCMYYSIERKHKARLSEAIIFIVILFAPLAFYFLRNLYVFGVPIKSAYIDELSAHPIELRMSKWEMLGYYLRMSDPSKEGSAPQLYNYGLLLFAYVGLIVVVMRRQAKLLMLFLPWFILFGPFHILWYFASDRFLYVAAIAVCILAALTLDTLGEALCRLKAATVLKGVAILPIVIIFMVITASSISKCRDLYVYNNEYLENDMGGGATKDACLALVNEGEIEKGKVVATNGGPMVPFYLDTDALYIGSWEGFDPGEILKLSFCDYLDKYGVDYLILVSFPVADPNVDEVLLEYLQRRPSDRIVPEDQLGTLSVLRRLRLTEEELNRFDLIKRFSRTYYTPFEHDVHCFLVKYAGD